MGEGASLTLDVSRLATSVALLFLSSAITQLPLTTVGRSPVLLQPTQTQVLLYWANYSKSLVCANTNNFSKNVPIVKYVDSKQTLFLHYLL